MNTVNFARSAARSTALVASLISTGFLGVGLLAPTSAQAQRFNPVTATASLGAFPQATGYYYFETSGTPVFVQNPNGTYTYKTLPVMTGPGGFKRYGAFLNGCALFNFDSITVVNGQHLVGNGSRPLVLLSRSTFQVNQGGTISVDGSNGGGAFPYTSSAGESYSSSGGAGGAGGGAGGNGAIHTNPQAGNFTPPQSGFGPGASPSNTILGSYTTTTGAGFGGNGGLGSSGGTVGVSYGGSLASLLQGGSGAGGTEYAGGGGGGGALEISAVNSIYISGTGYAGYAAVSAAGGSGTYGGPTQYPSGYMVTGGGSGGAIYLTAPSVYVSGLGTDVLSVAGGDGGNAPGGYPLNYGGSGGGGRLRVEYTGAAYSSTTTNTWTRPGKVLNQSYSGTTPTPGQPGEFVIASLSTATP